MGAIVGFVLGYVLGTKAGPNGNQELKDAWNTISSSDEVKELLSGGLAMARDAVGQGRALLGVRLMASADPDDSRIRRIA